MERIPSYSDIFAVGHKALAELFDGEVVVQEKIDGSQFSFARVGDTVLFRSKGKQIVADAPDKLFEAGIKSLLEIKDKLPEGWVFRAEYIQKPKHNTLVYGRVPSRNVVVFDVDTGNQSYLVPAALAHLCRSLELETVPVLHTGRIESVEQLKDLLPKGSVLGGAEPEGIVIKNYSKYAEDKKVLMGKYVRPEFKEANKHEFRAANPIAADIVIALIKSYRTEPRYRKAVQHLRDAGTLTQSPQDIGALLKEVEADVAKECRDEIKEVLWDWAWPKIARGIKGGLPEWYKAFLVEQAIPEKEAA